MKPSIVTALIAAALAISGCSEREQSARYENGKYRGKTDTRPSDNAPAAGPAAWKQGDHESWHNQLQSRNTAGQNEHRRIGH